MGCIQVTLPVRPCLSATDLHLPDAEEAARGAAAGKPREKFVRPADMLGFLDGGGG